MKILTPCRAIRLGSWSLVLLLSAAGIVPAQDENPFSGDGGLEGESPAENEFLEGSLLFYQQQYVECIESMDRVLDHDPDHREVYLVKGMAFLMLNRLPEACREFSDYGDRDPLKPEGYNLTGKLLFDYGFLSESEGFFRKAMALTPGDPGLYNNLGSVYVRDGRLDEARDTFEKGLVLDPDLPELHINLGIVYFIRNDLDAAETAFLRAIEINVALGVGDPVAYANLADVYLEGGDLTGAAKAYRLALGYDGTMSDVRSRLGMVHQILGETELAVDEYERAIMIGGEPSQTHSNLAMIHLESGRVRSALREFGIAIRMTGGSDPTPLEESGRIYDGMDLGGRALGYYRMAFKAGSRSTTLLFALARLCEQAGDDREALGYFAMLEEKSALDAEAFLSIARLCSCSQIDGIRDPKRGLEISRALADETGWVHAGILDVMAGAYASLGDFEQACLCQKDANRLLPRDSVCLPMLEDKLKRFQNAGD
jgi:tetratricopeptide (TPR) repeat protein